MLFPASVQPIVDASANVRVRDVDVISVYIDMQPIPFNRGYYSIDLTFFFDVSLELYGGATVGCDCLLYKSPSPRDRTRYSIPSSA